MSEGQRQTKRITTGYIPRVLQAELHTKLKRFNVLVCHRRFGKTVFAINDKIDRGLRNPLRNPQYAYFAPFYGQAKRVAWDYLKDYTRNIPGATVNEAELRVDIPRPQFNDRLRFMLMGADNPASVRGIYLDGVTLDEYAEMDPLVWTQVIRPTLTDRMGWATFIGTPKGQNHFWEIYKHGKDNPGTWFTALFKASETGLIHHDELMDAKSSMSNEEYEQEFECSFAAALIGAYFGKEMEQAEREKRITRVPYDKAVSVDTFWDLGIGDSLAIWFIQQVGREYHAIDYIEENGKDLSYYAAQLRNKQYVYREHVLPHDAAARELGTGKTRQESLVSFGIRGIIQARQDFDDGIHAVRQILGKCWFDAGKCERGIQALKNYEHKWDAKRKIFSAQPLHNWASHGSDAFRVFALGVRDNSSRQDQRKLPRMAESDYDVFSL
jgi:phage terminase large subunit